MRALLLLALGLCLFGCDTDGIDRTAYRLTYYDTEGTDVLATGTVHLEPGPLCTRCDQALTGTWTLDADGPPFPREESGVLAGVPGAVIQLEFLPRVADGGFTVRLEESGARVSGTWGYGTIAGPQEGGVVRGTVVR